MSITAIDLAAPIIGTLFIAIGASAVAAALSARPQINRSATWFGVFCLLYGIRLLSRSDLIQVVTGWPEWIFNSVSASITYAILLPATLFLQSLAPPRREALLRRTWQVLAVCAGGAILTDVIARRPFAAVAINVPMVVVTIAIWFVHLRRISHGERWSRDVRVVVGAGAILALAALLETIFSRGELGEIVVEPLAMLLFGGTLGWFVLSRSRRQELAYAAVSRELELARSIQQSLLPPRMPDVQGLRVAGAYIPMSAVAGDFYEVLPLSSGRTLVLVTDVSGHGVPAALIASMVKVAVAAEADRHDDPGAILTGINRALTGKFERAYVTATCVVTDPVRRTLTYAAAGHPPPLLRRADGRIDRLDQGGIVLALMPTATYGSTELTFEPGDRLLMYTDGLTEASRVDGDEFFGDAELDRVVKATALSSDLMGAVLDAHRRWIGEDTPVSDDISVVVIEHATDTVPAAT